MKRLVYLIIVLFLFAIIGGYLYYLAFGKNVSLEKEFTYLYIPSNAKYEQVLDSLKSKGIVQNMSSFKLVAERLDYENNVRPGKYNISNGMNNFDLVRLLRSGRQEPVKLILVKERTLDDVARLFASKLEVKADEMIQLLNNDQFLKQYGFNKYEVIALFVPNTYEFYWNGSAENVIARMAEEYKKFWNEERMQKLAAYNLSQTELTTIASIVEEETTYGPEKPTIAGVYLNRIRKGMLLQADPTVRFALQDFTIKRIGGAHLEYDSPFNTYKYPGIPPGPICTPSIATLDAVLNAEKHDYFYFCAKVGGKGHDFAKSYAEHQKNARKYRKYLNSRNIL